MTVPLAHDGLAVRVVHTTPGLEDGVVGAEPLGAALVADVALVVHQVDDRVRRVGIHLRGVGADEPHHVAGELDRHRLQAEAQAEARDVVLTGVPGGSDLALEAAVAEPAGDHDPVEVREPAAGEQTLDLLGLDPVDLDLRAMVEPGVLQALDDRQVGVLVVDVLADEADADRLGGGLDLRHHLLPRRQVDRGVETQALAHDGVEALLVEDQRQLVDVAGVGGVHDSVVVDVAEVRDLALQVGAEGRLAAAHDDVGLDAAAAQFGDRVLGGLGLLLSGRTDERHQRDVDVADVVAADVLAELAQRLEEREDLDVADGAADLGDDDVDVLGGETVDRLLISSVMCGMTCTVLPR